MRRVVDPLPTLVPEEQEQPLSPEQQVALREETKFAAGKIAFIQYFTVAVFLFLISGFWDLQVTNPERYREAADQNRIKSIPILAPRGKILDREGRLIVDNHSSFTALLSRESFQLEHLRPIADGLGLDPLDLEARLKRFHRPKYVPLVLKQELTPGEVAFIRSHQDLGTFPELELIHSQRRLYPENGLAAHVIGYVGEVSEAELNTAEFAKFNQGDVIGKTGIERQYNDSLMGVDGQRQVVVDNYGRERELLESKPAIPGKDLALTLDLDLQAVAELALEGRRGSVVALDPRSGEVLAMVSRPAFDPNKFAGRIRLKDWREIMDDPETPLINRAIQAQLAPGSTFKPLVALAGLETGTIDETFKVGCGGGASFYGRYFKCHQRGGHGSGVEIKRAIALSCDVYFYNVGNKLGIDRIAQYAEMAGLGKKTGIDLPHEEAGVMPSSAWKMRLSRQKWYAGETISVAIGQGAVAVTPLQLAHAIGGMALGGVWQRPHLVTEQGRDRTARRAALQPENVARVVGGMYAVVNEGGTGARSKLPGIELCGKTGTAQRASNTFLKGTKAGRSMKDNAWFVGFAGRENPEIVVAALFEEGEHGNLAAPIVRDVIKAYYDKKASRNKTPVMATFLAPVPGLRLWPADPTL